MIGSPEYSAMNTWNVACRLVFRFAHVFLLTCSIAHGDPPQNKDFNAQAYKARMSVRFQADYSRDVLLPDIFIKVVNISDTDISVRDVNGLFYGLISITTKSAKHVLINKRLEDALASGSIHRVTTIAPDEYLLYQVQFYEYVLHRSHPEVSPHAWWSDVQKEREVRLHVEAFDKAIMPVELIVLRNKESTE